jgi:hypothetical protein
MWINFQFIDQYAAHLAVTILLDDENFFMVKDEVNY